VAQYLKKQAANVVCIAEQASWPQVAAFGMSLWSSPSRLWQAITMGGLAADIRFGCWPVAARGSSTLEAVEFLGPRGRFTVPCDYMACSFGLVPNLELPRLLGCDVRDGFVRVDEWQRTSVENVYCAGEPTGIGGVDSALCEGQIAGLSAARQEKKAQVFFSRRRSGRRFEALLRATFALRSELRDLCQAETIVCRCEDVPSSRLRGLTGWREAKLQTRCGMGACQGRVCGASTEFLFGWQAVNTRSPIFPARVETLSDRVVAN